LSPNAADAAPDPGSAWAVRIARVSGIPIRIHFTFLLFVIWIAWFGLHASGSLFLVSLLALFFCIILHELGHSLVAQRFGHRVRDITLYPIGGVASIEGSPTPVHEFFIAIAGPAVNVVIAGILAAILGAAHQMPEWSWPPWASQQNVGLLQSNPLAFLLIANLSVVAFNMLPAFPMDGGRVLRALLGLAIGKPKATFVASAVGQFLAVMMGLFGAGVFNSFLHTEGRNYGLCVIALFVYFGAGQERQIEQVDEYFEDVAIRDVMIRDWHSLRVGETLQHATGALRETQQQDFPVLDDAGAVVGVLSRRQLLHGLAEHGQSAPVSEVMTADPLFATPEEGAEDYLLRDDGVRRAPVLVRNSAGELVGMVTAEHLMEFMAMRQVNSRE